jgi:hypothetical protein
MAAGLLIRLEEADIGTISLADHSEPHVFSPAGAVSANPQDIVRENVRSAGIDNGCCGSDGMDGPNRACLCGAILGTEWSDCWTQAEVRFNPDAILIVG